jgi:hypothetical protein
LGAVFLKFERFFALFCVFLWQGRVYDKKEPLESIEIVEFYLEPTSAILEPVEERIGERKTGIS